MTRVLLRAACEPSAVCASGLLMDIITLMANQDGDSAAYAAKNALGAILLAALGGPAVRADPVLGAGLSPLAGPCFSPEGGCPRWLPLTPALIEAATLLRTASSASATHPHLRRHGHHTSR